MGERQVCILEIGVRLLSGPQKRDDNSVGRVTALHAVSHRFEPCSSHQPEVHAFMRDLKNEEDYPPWKAKFIGGSLDGEIRNTGRHRRGWHQFVCVPTNMRAVGLFGATYDEEVYELVTVRRGGYDYREYHYKYTQ